MSNKGTTHWEGCYNDRRHHDCALTEIVRLRQRVAELKAALEPFAHPSLHTLCGGNIEGDDSPIYERSTKKHGTVTLRIGDFKRAHNALRHEGGNDEERGN